MSNEYLNWLAEMIGLSSKKDIDLPPMAAVLRHYGAKVNRDYGQVNLRCPFHDDSHQSASANLDKNVFICFACGMQGNSIQIICEHEGVKFGEAKRIAEGIAGQGGGEVRGKHLSGGRLPQKKGNSRGDSTAGAIRRSRGTRDGA